MAADWSLRRCLGCSLIAALVLAALMGIYVFVLGDFAHGNQILLTTLSLSYFSVTSLGCTVVLERRRALLLAVPGLATSLSCFVWSLLIIWCEWNSEPMLRTMAVLAIFSFAFAQACLLAIAPLRGRLSWVFAAALVCIFALAGLISAMVLFGLDDELLFRLAGVLGILDACSSLSVPVLYRLTDSRPAEPIQWEETAQRQGLQIELPCPKCGRRGTYAVGLIDCPECSLQFRVEIRGSSRPAGSGPFQFSLRAMLLAFVVVSLPLGWFGSRMSQLRRQRAVVVDLQRLGPTFSYQHGNVTRIGFYDSDPARFDASVLVRLKELPKLESLDLSGMPITDDELAYLERVDVKSLTLSNTSITGDGLAHLKQMRNLETLWLSGTKVDDGALAHLKGMASLRRLSLQSTKIGDTGLAHLEDLTSLNELQVTDTAVTARGVARLERANARVHVSVEFPAEEEAQNEEAAIETTSAAE